jgi:hypothetical protein
MLGTRGRIRVILRLRKMQALRKPAKQGKHKCPLDIYAYRFKSSHHNKSGATTT